MTGRRFKKSYTEHMRMLGRHQIKWIIVDEAYPLKAGTKSCDLCNAEKMYIALVLKAVYQQNRIFTKTTKLCSFVS